jgi:hypothetical protein
MFVPITVRAWIPIAALTLSSLAMGVEPRPALQPERGVEIGTRYQAWLSPHQEGGEEADTPAMVPRQFRATTASLNRDERKSAGHGVLRFTRDLSRAYVDVRIAGIDPASITMFHIHCGKPGMLGPILVDLGMKRDIRQAFAGNLLTAEIRNEDLVAVVKHSHGPIGFFTGGCPILIGNPLDRVKTIAGMAALAREGDLYFNLHTTGQNYYGDIRGQLEVMRD